jgi:hypothetical protein
MEARMKLEDVEIGQTITVPRHSVDEKALSGLGFWIVRSSPTELEIRRDSGLNYFH